MKTNLLVMQSSIKWYVDQKSNKYSIIMNLLNYYKFYLWMLFNNPVSVNECNYHWNIVFQIFHLTVSICLEWTLFSNKSVGYLIEWVNLNFFNVVILSNYNLYVRSQLTRNYKEFLSGRIFCQFAITKYGVWVTGSAMSCKLKNTCSLRRHL